MSTLEEAIETFEKSDKQKVGEIVQAGNILRAQIRDSDPVAFWNLTTDADPANVGNNLSRVGQTYHHMVHPKGQLWQNGIKKIIIKAIDSAHYLWIKVFGKDAFVYDDPRLKSLDEWIKAYVAENVSEGEGYKDILILKGADIVLGLMKEDIYWRVLIFDCINKFCGHVVFPLATVEEETKKLWH